MPKYLTLSNRIDNAIRWYRENREDIQRLLPLRLPWIDGVGFSIYQENWDITCWCDKWEQKEMSADDAKRLICDQLRPIRDELRRRQKATNHG